MLHEEDFAWTHVLCDQWTFGCGYMATGRASPSRTVWFCWNQDAYGLLLRWWHGRHRIWGGCLTAFLLREMKAGKVWRTSHHRWCKKMKQRCVTKQKTPIQKKTMLIPSICIYLPGCQVPMTNHIGWKDPKLQRQNNGKTAAPLKFVPGFPWSFRCSWESWHEGMIYVTIIYWIDIGLSCILKTSYCSRFDVLMYLSRVQFPWLLLETEDEDSQQWSSTICVDIVQVQMDIYTNSC